MRRKYDAKYFKELKAFKEKLKKNGKKAMNVPVAGDIVTLSDKKYEVQKNGSWKRLDL